MTLEKIYAVERTLSQLEKDVLVIRQQARSPGSQIWYLAICTQDLVKASGRGIRHKDDYCITYLLGEQI